MGKKNNITIRVRAENRDILNKLSFTMSEIQQERVSVPEVIRRALNVPNMDKELLADAIFKKKKK